MIPGFHVGSLLLHRQSDAIALVAELGYRCVAVRPRPGSLDRRDTNYDAQLREVAQQARAAGMRVILDTDAAYMHRPDRIGIPALAGDMNEADAACRWIEAWIADANAVGASMVTLSSGRESSGSIPASISEQTLERLSVRLEMLCGAARQRGVMLALRPRHGDAVATVAQFERLQQWLPDSLQLKLAADVGEMMLGHELPVVDRLARMGDALACVYLCDHRSGSSGDQRIGHGDVAVSRIVRGLAEHRYHGPAIVRVDGHSELGLTLASEAWSLFAGI